MLGDNIRERRAARGWSQHDLATMADLSAAYVSELETNHKQPSLNVLARLAEVLKVTPAELLTEGT
jgi:transcriptional regulator with XRE-family HTH domain